MFDLLRTRRAFGFLALLWLNLVPGVHGISQTPGAAQRNMLWRVQTGTSVVYLLGSVHALPKSMYPLPSPIERAFDSSDRVVFELNLDSLDQLGSSMAIMMKGVYMDGRTLKDGVSKATYAKLKKRVKQLGLEMSMFNLLKPWMAAFMLMGTGMQQGGMQAEYGIDFYFHKKAGEQRKPVAGLETVDDQISVFSELPDKAQEQFLRQMLDAKQSTNELDIILKSWRSGDLTILEKLLSQYVKSDSILYEGLVFRRNRNWIPQIESYLKGTERYLVVVGALHLVGPGGVVDLLRQRGYTVEQL